MSIFELRKENQSTEIYELVCKLYWKTDLGIDGIITQLKQYDVTEYIHTSITKCHYTDLREAVNRIISSEQGSWAKASQFKIKNNERKSSTAVFRIAQ